MLFARARVVLVLALQRAPAQSGVSYLLLINVQMTQLRVSAGFAWCLWDLLRRSLASSVADLWVVCVYAGPTEVRACYHATVVYAAKTGDWRASGCGEGGPTHTRAHTHETISEGADCNAPSIGTARHTTATAASVASNTV